MDSIAIIQETYTKLKADLTSLREAGKLPLELTRAEKISWAYGNAAIENPNVTVEMVERVIDALQETVCVPQKST